MATIKSGFRITVVSWENDADHYNTISRDGLTKELAVLTYRLLSLLEGDESDGKFGNMYEPRHARVVAYDEALFSIVDGKVDIMDSHYGNPVRTEPLSKIEMADFASQIIGDYTGYSEGYVTRMVDSILVEYAPQEVTFTDVTAEICALAE